MTKTAITIEIDEAQLTRYADAHLAMLWHVAQANPADGFDTSTPGDLAEKIGREIIRRWLKTAPDELWRHQGRHYYQATLSKFAKYQPGGKSGTPEWNEGEWVPKATAEDTDANGDRP